MRTFIAVLVGLICGFMIGIALSSSIGIMGMMLFNQPIGIKYLPYFTAILCAVIVPMMDNKSRTKS